MASLGSLVIELAANTARLQSDLGKAVGMAERTANRFKTAFKFAGGGLLGAAITSTIKQSIQFGDEIAKASTKAGIGAKRMSELAYAAKLADVDLASLSTALKKMQVSMSEVTTGAKGPTLALAALGLTIGEIQKRKPDQQFELLADRISKLTDPADRARAAVELFGKAGADLLPMFEQGAAGIAKARAEAEKLGLSFSDEQIKKLSTADDSIKRLDASWKGFATTLTALVAGPLAAVLDGLSGLDSRSVDAQIAAMDKMIAAGGGRDRMMKSLANAPEFFRQYDELKGRRELEAVRAAQTGTSGGPQGRSRTGTPIGFAAADAADKAAELAEKARAEDLKNQEKWAKDAAEINHDLNVQFGKELDENLQEDYERYIKYYEDLEDARIEDQRKIEAWRKEQAMQISENAQLFKDAFLNAWDDMVNTGKFKWDELLKYMIAEFARRGIVKLFDGIFGGGSGGGGTLGGFGRGLLDIFKPLGGIFGGGRASGGNVQAGKVYEVGERGREFFAPGMSGGIIPNGAMGGVTVHAPIYMDNRGATTDLIKLLPAFGKRISEETEARIVERLDRGWY